MLTLGSVQEARQRISGRVHHTPLAYQSTLSQLLKIPLYLKLENLQKTGAFKLRGALNKLLQIQSKGNVPGVVAASAGNHAQGVAWAARELGIRSLIVMPRGAAVSKVAATKSYGAEVLLEGDTYDDAHLVALDYARREGLTLIPAFDDEAVAAGQGTLGLEILDALPESGTIVVPVGGGGLIAGLAVAVKELRPDIRVIGVEAMGADSFYRSLNSADASRVTLSTVNTIADGIAVKSPGHYTYPIVQQYVDEMVTVTDDEIAGAILMFMERLKLVVEGAGAASLAALLAGRVTLDSERPVVAIVSGGNIDVDMIARIIERGLVRSGRRLQLRVQLPDRPGALHAFTGVIAKTQANILGIEHDRTGAAIPIGKTEVILSVAVHDTAHGDLLINHLTEAGYVVVAPSHEKRQTTTLEPETAGYLGTSFGLFG